MNLNGSKVSNYGHAFERRVEKAFIKNGYALIDSNQWNRNYDLISDAATKREFDLVLFNTHTKEFCVVECKAHLNKKNLVSLEQLVLFSHKIKNYGAKDAVPILVTDTAFRIAALKYAVKSGISLMDGEGFACFEKNGSLIKAAKSRIASYFLRKAFAQVNGVLSSFF